MSRLAAWWLDVHPIGEAFVVTTAPTTAQVEAILWREIGKAHRKGNLPGRITLDAKWYMGQELVAYGRKPADYDQAAFQGIYSKYVLVLLDEAVGIPKPSESRGRGNPEVVVRCSRRPGDQRRCTSGGSGEPGRPVLALCASVQTGLWLGRETHQRLRHTGVYG
jgi:hypothetical protein